MESVVGTRGSDREVGDVLEQRTVSLSLQRYDCLPQTPLTPLEQVWDPYWDISLEYITNPRRIPCPTQCLDFCPANSSFEASQGMPSVVLSSFASK